MEKTNKPQCQAARDFIMALHAKAAGKITEKDLREAGDNLDRMVEIHGKP
jgi:hypothetical protein